MRGFIAALMAALFVATSARAGVGPEGRRHAAGSRIATTRPAPRSTRRRRSRPSCRSCRSTTTWWSSIPSPSRTRPTHIVPDLATEWAWSDDGTRAHLQAARRREVARRQAVHQRRREMHLGHADRRRGSEAAQESAQVVVVQPQGGDVERRPRGHLPSRPAAALGADHARRRLLAGLSLPRAGRADAHQADRHRPVQVRRAQAERIDQAGAQPRLLEAGPALSRRASSSRIIANRATSLLAFTAGKFDLTFTAEIAAPLLKDLKAQAPKAICEMLPTNTQANLLVNRDKPPFDNAQIRTAMVLAIDRKAFIDIIEPGHQHDRRHHAAAAGRPLGHAGGDPGHRCRATAPTSRRAAPRAARSWTSSATAPTSRSRSRSRPATSRPIAIQAVILIDHLKQVYIQGELEPLDTAVWYNRMARKDYTVGLNVQGVGIDDPDVVFYETFSCGSERNYTELLQSRDREAVRAAVAHDRQRGAPASWCGRSTRSCRKMAPARDPARLGRHLLAARGQGAEPRGQHDLQSLAFEDVWIDR